nr:unnamed protein product [Digitaria exilis]
MAFQTPGAVLLDENMPIHRGKRNDAPRAKPLKPLEKKPGLQERKALQDVSNFANGTALKDRSMKGKSQQRKALQNVTNTTQSKDRPSLKEQRSTLKERSGLGKHDKSKNAMNGLRMGWRELTSMIIRSRIGICKTNEVDKFFEEEKGLELEPEILPNISWGISHSGDKAKVVAEDPFTDDELDQYPFLDNNPAMFELRDEPAIPQLGVY